MKIEEKTAKKSARFADDVGQKQRLLNPSNDIDEFDDRKDEFDSRGSNVSMKKEAEWKPSINISYETLCLTDTTLN
jgi:hypothetical protein